MRVALVCALIICALIVAIGIGVLFVESYPLLGRCGLAIFTTATGVGFGSIVIEELKG